MKLLAKLFVSILEFALFFLVAVPASGYALSLYQGDMVNGPTAVLGVNSVFELTAWLIVYYICLIMTFGVLSIMVSNWKNLQRIVLLLEDQKLNDNLRELPSKTSEARRIEPSIRRLSD
jgi:hypothetical protein